MLKTMPHARRISDQTRAAEGLRNFFRTALFLLCWAWTLFPAKAQSVPIGQWNAYLPYNYCVGVAQSDESVFFATPWAVFAVDKADYEYTFLNKVSGLSDAGVRLIRYNRANGTLLIAYENGNLDIWKDGAVRNVPDLLQSLVPGDKTINHVAFDGENALLATNLGVLLLDMARAEIRFTAFSTDPVLSVAVFGDHYYAASGRKIRRMERDQLLPNDWANWQPLGGTGLPANYDTRCLEPFDGRLFADIDDTLRFSSDGWNWQDFAVQDGFSGQTSPFYAPGTTLRSLDTDPNGERMVLVAGGLVAMIEPGGRYWNMFNPALISSPYRAVHGGNGQIWIADYFYGALQMDAYTSAQQRFVPNAPAWITAFDMEVAPNGDLWVASGGTDYIQPAFNGNGVYRLHNGTWINYNLQTDSVLLDSTVFDFLSVAADPITEEVYFATFGDGPIRFDGNGFQTFTGGGTPLRGPGGIGPARCFGVDFDREGNLWAGASLSPTAPVCVRKRDGTWRGFACPFNNVAKLAVDRNGYKWFTLNPSNLLVYDSGADLDNPNDDRYKTLSPSNSELPTGEANCLAVDLNGDVWVGTQQGVTIFQCGSNLFDGSCPGYRPVVTRDDFNRYLLESENVRCIQVDGANRKWIGTDNGLFLVSDDGEEQIEHFTVQNSPLFDNSIACLALNGRTGELFVGTEKGILSYRTTATTGGETHTTNLAYAFPNPVRPDYAGPIAIRGLVRDAWVKITDISGTLVYETQALGGQMVWDGNDYNGRRANSGVYLVFSSSTDGQETFVTKLVLLK
jgi:streptogramin lyase